ncbi:unnamed protein product [Sphagnum jensenii]
MPRRTENCGVKCNYCSGLGYSEDRCWKKPRDGKSPSGAANFLEVMISDEAATLQQLNKLCGSENIFSHTRVPRRRVPVEVAAGGADPTPQIVGDGIGVDHDAAVRSKILSHFIKGKVSLSPMETILLIPGELEHLESLVKLARRRRDTESTPTGHNHDWVADKERTIVPKGDAASSSDSDTGTDGSEHGDAVSSPVKQVECEDEFGEDELGQLVKSEGPSEILQLILQEQANDFMNEEITEGDDYAD